MVHAYGSRAHCKGQFSREELYFICSIHIAAIVQYVMVRVYQLSCPATLVFFSSRCMSWSWSGPKPRPLGREIQVTQLSPWSSVFRVEAALRYNSLHTSYAFKPYIVSRKPIVQGPCGAYCIHGSYHTPIPLVTKTTCK